MSNCEIVRSYGKLNMSWHKLFRSERPVISHMSVSLLAGVCVAIPDLVRAEDI